MKNTPTESAFSESLIGSNKPPYFKFIPNRSMPFFIRRGFRYRRNFYPRRRFNSGFRTFYRRPFYTFYRRKRFRRF